jgi:plasmid stabilization system protein ParE
MRYTVIWTPDALDQLADVWLRATNRNAVTQAAYQIDQILRDDPGSKGVEFYGDRLLVVTPLQVIFVTRPDDRLVEVQQVW